MPFVANNLTLVRERMERTAERMGRDPTAIKLVAVSKQQTIESIFAAYEAGQRCFGESRAQELERKAATLPNDIEWHFIGPLQSNKVRNVRPLVKMLHSLDRTSIITGWGRERDVPALLQFRLGDEPTKAGFEPEEWADATELCLATGVSLAGVMSIPPPAVDPESVRPWFRMLREISENLTDAVPSATVISMGMSHDFEIAIEEGASAIRVGSAIFGSR